MNSRQNQTNRVLSMYDRLCKGHVLTKIVEADSFQVGGEKRFNLTLNAFVHFLKPQKQINI
jgi:hypothetical protein